MTEHTGLPDQATTEAVLQEINKIRARLGLPPVRAILRGRRIKAAHCPIARTVGLGYQQKVTIGGWIYTAGVEVGILSEVCHQFVMDFDRGEYPGLVLK